MKHQLTAVSRICWFFLAGTFSFTNYIYLRQRELGSHSSQTREAAKRWWQLQCRFQISTMKKLLLLFVFTAQTLIAQQDFFNDGNNELNKNNDREAEILFRKAIELDRDNLMFKSQLALSLINQGKSNEAETEIENILKVNPDFTAALWYGGINSFQNMKDFRKSILYFEKAYPLIGKQSPQYFAVNFYIGKCYRNLLRSEGLSYSEVDRMIQTLHEYVELQPNAEDANEVSIYIQRIKENRPPTNVKKWTFTSEENIRKILENEINKK